ncbi:MAG: hypothetical protein H6719_11055 [Sandaracinaceae bacterium]|nr:hypothetical protein [Sandaracinaceae bacterium]
MRLRLQVGVALGALWLGACDGGAPEDAGADGAVAADAGAPVDASGLPPPRDPWPTFAAPPDVELALFDDAPWLLDANRWRTEYDVASDTPERARRGGFGLGNGHVFAFVGIGEPDLATVHELVGPTYDKGEAFFSDVELRVRVAGAPWRPTTQWQWEVRSTAVVVTLSRGPDLDVVTVDFAPWTRAAWSDPAAPEERAIVRLVAVRSTGTSSLSDVEVALGGIEGWTDEGGAPAQRRSGGARLARLSAVGGTTDGASREARIARPTLAPGEETRGVFVLSAAGSDAATAETLDALGAADALALAEATRDAWRGWAATGARLTTPEPMVDDLVEAARVMLKVQEAANGATCPMSEYTGTWLRDAIGPVIALAALGHHDDVRAMLDAQYAAIVTRGDLANRLRSDLDPAAPLPPTPDFRALGALEGRVRAEGPSYVVLAYDEEARWTGSRARVDERFDLLFHAAADQQRTPDDLLPYSGDETYRTAMAFSLGFGAAEQFVDGFVSSDSSFLLVVAAERLAASADALGRSADADALRELAARVRASADALYWNEEGGFFAPLASDPDRVPWPAPFEDVSEKPAWLGYFEAGDPRARRSLTSLVERLGLRDRGFPATPADARHAVALRAIGTRYGMHTGMSAGYFLGAAAALDLPEAEAAFDAIGRTANTTGSWSEYMVYEDHANVALGYDPDGPMGEYTARYRPWEGGIDLRALLDYLAGLRPELDPTPRLHLAPRLPAGWDRFALEGLRLGAATLDLVVSDAGDGASRVRRYELTEADGVDSVAVAIGLRLPAGELEAVTIDGAPVDLSTVTLDPDRERLRAELAPVAVAPAATVVVEARYTPTP